MDQTQLSGLDPKLKEAYNRVMQTPTRPLQPPPQQPAPAQQEPASQQTQPQPAQQPQPTQSQPNQQQPVQDLPVQTPPTQQQQQPIINHINTTPLTGSQPAQQAAVNTHAAKQQMQAFVASEVTGVHQSLKMIQLAYVVGGLVFFAVYALFWMKFFNISTPF